MDAHTLAAQAVSFVGEPPTAGTRWRSGFYAIESSAQAGPAS
jgi:hypothetical protein